jgi:hypothetical protein
MLWQKLLKSQPYLPFQPIAGAALRQTEGSTAGGGGGGGGGPWAPRASRPMESPTAAAGSTAAVIDFTGVLLRAGARARTARPEYRGRPALSRP